MICRPCRNAEHVDCVDHEPDQADQCDEKGNLSVEPLRGLVSRRCFCQHKVRPKTEPETGDPHDC